MFRKVVEVKRLFLISPEVLCVLIVLLSVQWFPLWFHTLSESVRASQGLPGYIGAVPLMLTGFSYKLGMAILRPGDEEENKVLYEWPLYWALEARVYSSIAICGLAAVGMALFYLNPFYWSDAASGAVLVGSVSVSVITVIPLIFGKMAIRKIVTLHR